MLIFHWYITTMTEDISEGCLIEIVFRPSEFKECQHVEKVAKRKITCIIFRVI